MSATKIMIVDDSPFSRTIIADALAQAGCEVVGEADGMEHVIEIYDRCKPDIVTMDIAMPGADGFECSKLLLLHDRDARIILISSMKDDETVAEARRAGIAGYVQKPVEAAALLAIINKVLSPDDLFGKLTAVGQDMFKEALAHSITQMTKTTVSFSEAPAQTAPFTSQGITVVLGIIGQYSGSMLLDISLETAEKMAEAILRRPVKSRDEAIAMAGEFANVAGGIACSMLNQREAFGFRVAPPSICFGPAAEVVSPHLNIAISYAETEYGRITLGVGFKKGSVLWM